MKNFLLGFLASLFLSCVSPGPAVAADCTANIINTAEGTLPPAILVPNGSTPLAAFSHAYGCDMAGYDPWKGVTIYDADGADIGNVFSLAVDQKSGNSFVLFQPVTGDHKFAINADSLKDYTAPLNDSEIAAVTTDARKKDYFSFNGGELTKEDFSSSIHVETMASISSAASPSDLAAFNFHLPPGLKPYGDREPIAISSKPVGAEVDFAGQAAGETSNMFLVREADLQSVELVEVGYAPCHFSDGTYKLTSKNGAVGSFFCALRRK